MEPKEQIRERIDVVDLVGEYLTLKGAGQGAFKALCPFHGEKTPSFHVNRQKQIWHCFGCDKGGDIFAFVMEMEGMEFREALEHLAQKAGVELPKYDRKSSDDSSRLKAINGFAEAVYRKYLLSDAGKEASDYLEGRGIPGELAEKFGIGYAPKGWDNLMKIAQQKKIGSGELMQAGLALKSKRGTMIDRFRHRLMIPLRDRHGNTLGFTGRVLDPEDNPKYMNSPQTPVYDKSTMLFGLDLAKTAIKTEKAVVVVEGNLDVVASHKAGVEHIVASSGTALTDRQINILKRYTTQLIFAFDTDAAGFEAARRGMRLASELGCDVRVASIPPEMGKDPDDVVQKDPDAWRNIVREHVDKMTFFFDRLVASVDPNDVQGKKLAGKEFLPEVAALADKIEREHWTKRFAETLDLPLQTVRDLVAGKKVQTRPSRPVQATSSELEAPRLPAADKTIELMFSLAWDNWQALKLLVDELSDDVFADKTYRDLYVQLVFLYNAGNSSPNKSLFEAVRTHISANEPGLTPLVDRIALAGERYLAANTTSQRDATPLHDLMHQIKERSKKARRDRVLAELKRAEHAGDTDRITELTRQYQSLL